MKLLGLAAGSDLVMDSRGWTSAVVGNVSRWIDLDAPSFDARLAAEKAFKQEIAWATHLSVNAVVLPPVRAHQQCANYARVLNQAATQAQYLQFWLRVPLTYRQGSQLDDENMMQTDRTISVSGAIHDDEEEELDPWMVRRV